MREREAPKSERSTSAPTLDDLKARDVRRRSHFMADVEDVLRSADCAGRLDVAEAIGGLAGVYVKHVASCFKRVDEADATAQRLTERIEALEKQVTGVQTKADHLERNGLTFGGEFQTSLHYSAGALVSHKGAIFIAVKGIGAGREPPPGRAGSGWASVI